MLEIKKEKKRIDKMKSIEDKKKKFIDLHFENLVFILRMHLDMSKEEVLKEIEARLKDIK